MKQIKKALKELKIAVVNYFSENVEIKINRSVIGMSILIPIGAFMAWYVNNKHS